MRRIVRRTALAAGSLAICGALLAIAPRAHDREPQRQAIVQAAPAAPAPAAPTVPPPPYRQADLSAAFAAADFSEAAPSGGESLDLVVIPTAAPPTARPAAAAPRPLRVAGYGPRLRGKLVAQTPRIDVYVGSGTFSADDVASVAWKLESLLVQDESGLYPTKLDQRISVGFYSKGSSPGDGTRGIAYTDSNIIEIYYSGHEDISAAFTIAAHELAHHVQAERYGAAVQSRADIILLEGGATWVSGVRWLKEYGVPSWRGRAFQLHGQGVPLVLVGAQRYGSDNAYELWASFVSYIYKRYGMATVDELYRSSRGRGAGSADYKGVTGKTLAQLTADWRAWVLAYEPPPPPTPEPTPAPATPTPAPVRSGR